VRLVARARPAVARGRPKPQATPKDTRELVAAIRSLAPVSDRAFAAWLELVEPRTFPRGGWLLRAGERAEWVHFVVEGLVRELYISEAGDEHTRVFLAEGQLTGSLLDLLSGESAVTWIQALEPTRTLTFRHDAFDALCESFPELHRVARSAAERLAVRKVRREHEMLALPAATRHERWLRESGPLDARVTRRHLASYLGVTPEHLSRLRRR
jgi:CRP-like cAMP-binding protein